MSDPPRKLMVTADLHFRLYPKGDSCTEELARRVCEGDADVFIVAGDVGDAAVETFEECLMLFADFDGLKLVVPGNHDLWTDSESSEVRYREALPEAAARAGFHYLDREPVVRDGVGFIGSIGWYDYSFRNEEIGVSLEDYRRKSVPGLCSWNDRLYIRWDLDDDEFTRQCVEKLRRHYSEIEPKVDQVVAVLHHIPFAELLYGPADVPLEFCRAYLGSERFGRMLSRCPKVRYVFCGHRHGADAYREENLSAFVVGSEYRLKRLLVLDLETGSFECIRFAPGEEAGRDAEEAPDEEAQ